ncbi:RND family efflux transporter, MFP subunit [Nitrosomonas aestuarii]|uniref:RND family efflux transporter, MFP subunit n=1 Tax=Nitrosomonas aestuarii TaxID=52441 RepID=A0A1I4D8Q9_9PROT|nr:efflux RND transporter periplasmic adaptor subunit [Nitrosomonas aestuarii]SFK89872.1 RND family efflux transporter, MFP subunit [Nitrosomonas aestuarii]
MFNVKIIRTIFQSFLFVSLLYSIWFWYQQAGPAQNDRDVRRDVVQVVSAEVSQIDVPVRLVANGIVTAKQMVDVRPQISATIEVVHIREGQFVQKGDKLFTLDARVAEANHRKTEARLAKSRSDLANAERQLQRHRELFDKGFISHAALDEVHSQVDSLRGQLGFDRAAVEATNVIRSFTEIIAPISGRTGAIPVNPGSLVTPDDAAMVSITQIDPMHISFSLPEREFNTIQQALTKGQVNVSVQIEQTIQQGSLIFVDNAVDTASGTIRLKAEFSNSNNYLWPGMYAKVMLAPRLLAGVFTVPVQAVQTGPKKKFVYVIEQDSSVIFRPVDVRLIQDGLAVIEGEGIASGVRVVAEGAQNITPGSVVVESATYDKTAYSVLQASNWLVQTPDRSASEKHGFEIETQ